MMVYYTFVTTKHRLEVSRKIPGFSSFVPGPLKPLYCVSENNLLFSLHILASTITSLVAKLCGFVSYWLLLSVAAVLQAESASV